jgi:hypothetical protein
MENIWYIFGISVFAFIGLIIFGIIIYIRKSKYYILSEIIIIAMFIFLLVESVPYIKDIAQQETTEITAVYVEYQKGSVDPGAWRLILKNGNETYKIISPIITKIHVKMEVGKTYKIEYLAY